MLIYGPQWQLERVDVTGRPTKESVEYRTAAGRLELMRLYVWQDYMIGAEVMNVANES